MTLFSDPACPYCHRVRIVLAEKGISVDVVDVDARNLPDEVMDFNPYGTVPTLVDRDLRLYESRIIMEYLDERFPVARANARLFMWRVERDWFALMDVILREDGAQAEAARAQLRDSLVGTGPVFGAKRFFMSDELSLVDCCIAPLLWRLPVLGIELPPEAKEIQDYTKRIFKWPAFKGSLTEAEHEMIADLR